MEGDRVMRYLSVCSGIEAASAAWMPLGWRPVAFSEIEPFPTSVLAHHHPGVPNWGDMTKYKEWPDEPIDLLCGGTPCQSFSVAGLRKGLADPRGNLMLTFGAIAAKYRPRWLVWENVPGVLSSNGGRDFGSFLGLLGELGYGFAYRVLDAQYVRVQSHPRAVPQRRRRVFVVGHSGGLWQRAAAVLFERASLCGHPAPSREAGQVAPTIPSRSTAGGGLGTDFDCDGGLQVAGTMKACKDSGGWSNSADHAAAGYMVPVRTICVATGQAGAEIGADMAPTLNCNHEALYVARSLRGEGFDASEDGTGRGALLAPVAFSCKDYGGDAGPISPTLRSMGHDGSHANAGGQVAVAFIARQDPDHWHNRTGPLDTDGSTQAVSYAIQASEDGTGRGTPLVPMFLHVNKGRPAGRQSAHTEMVSVKPIVETLTTDGHAQSAVAVPVAFDTTQITSAANYSNPKPGDPCHPLAAGQHAPAVATQWAVRRLTPLECERLMGFPDGHTAIPHKGKPAADGPRYKALGNSWAVNCASWIGERIEAVEAIAQQKVEAA